MHLPLIDIMMLFSSTRTMPTFVRILPGSIRNVSAMSKTIEIAGVEKCLIVADKGFFSSGNKKALKKNHLIQVFNYLKSMIFKLIDKFFFKSPII